MHLLGVEHDVPPGAHIVGADTVDDKIVKGEQAQQGKDCEKNIQ
jgi:hypothetical protein